MRLPTILNRVEKFQSFVDGEASLEPCDDALALVVPREPRKNGRGYGSSWGRPGPADDRLEQGRFEFVPVWGILVFLAERLRRVNCRRCGVTVAMVPWCDGENPLTTTYRGDRAAWAKRLSGSAVGSIFRTSWDSVRRAVECAVECGLAHRDLRRRLGASTRSLGSVVTRIGRGWTTAAARRDGCWPWPRGGRKRGCGAAWKAAASRSAWG